MNSARDVEGSKNLNIFHKTGLATTGYRPVSIVCFSTIRRDETESRRRSFVKYEVRESEASIGCLRFVSSLPGPLSCDIEGAAKR